MSTAILQRRVPKAGKGRLEFSAVPVPPFRLDLAAWTLRRNPRNIVDRWDGRTYRRVVHLPSGPAEIAVTQSGPSGRARLKAVVEGRGVMPADRAAARRALDRLLGLRVDLAGFYRLAAGERQLKLLANAFRGMKPPRYETVFECAVTAVASQQVTRTVSIILLNRLVERYGPAVGAAHAFPGPRELAGIPPEDVRRLGFSTQKARAITELAGAVRSGAADLEGLEALSDEEAVRRLESLRGIGRWSAEYVLLRGLGRIRVFPGDDVGARNNLRYWLHRERPLDYGSVRRILRRWYPYAGLIYFHMLLNRLSEAGYLKGD